MLIYKEAKNRKAESSVERSTSTINSPSIEDVLVLTRTNQFEIPKSKIRCLDEPGDLYFSAVVLCKVDNTDIPTDDYVCYHPNPTNITMFHTAKIYNPDWPNPHEFDIDVEDWQERLWGNIDRIRWCEVRPEIYDNQSDRIWYQDSIVLGDWTIPYQFPPPPPNYGWGWQESSKTLSEGTLRYRVHIEKYFASQRLEEATTPRGIELFRVSTKGDYNNGVVDWAFSYVGVPYVRKTNPAPLGRNIHNQLCAKWIHHGYEGNECAGLACWAFIWDGEPITNFHPESGTDTSFCLMNTDAERLHGFQGGPQHVVVDEYYGSSDNDEDWNGIDDADINENGVIEFIPEEWIPFIRKLYQVTDGDM
jgi:hypothetical protein